MITSVGKILKLVDNMASFSTSEPWDNCGLIIGRSSREVSRILFSLDLTQEVLEEAIDEGFDLIITHHPVIFSPLKAITSETHQGQILLKLIENNISVISAHTNLDKSFKYGINRVISEAYGLVGVSPLVPEDDYTGFGVFGALEEPMEIKSFINRTKEIFGLDTIKASNVHENKIIKRVAISSGASSDFIERAISVFADAMILGDLKHHEAQGINGTNLTLIDVGHYESEAIYLEYFKDKLDEMIFEKNYDVFTKVSEMEKPQIQYF